MKALKAYNPTANIVAVDYDPGASEVNQLNRIKLMIAVAKSNLAEQKAKELEEHEAQSRVRRVRRRRRIRRRDDELIASRNGRRAKSKSAVNKS